jgi:hypothetical protein
MLSAIRVEWCPGWRGIRKVSVEHVVNVLSRLNAAPAPPTAATHLKTATPPLADTARYDRLRADTVDANIEGADHEA